MKEQTWQIGVTKWITLGLILLIPLLVGAEHLFPFTTSKGLMVIMGTAAASVFYLWGRLKESVNKISIGFLDIVFSLFLGVLVLTSFTGVVPNLSFFGSFEGMSSILVCSFIVFGFLIAYLLRNKLLTIKEVFWTVLASVLFGVFKIWSTNFTPESVTDAGFIGNSSYAGAYLLLALFFALALFIIEKSTLKKVGAGVVLLSIITSPILFNINIFKGLIPLKTILSNPTLLGGVANGAIVGIVVGLFAAGTLFLVRSKKKFTQWGGLLLLVGVFSGLWFAGQALVNPETKLHQFYVADKNANRFVFWDIAYAGANDKPLLGWGMNAYAYVFQEKFDPIFFSPGYAVEIWTNNPHNMMAEYTVNTGYLGLFAYLFVIGGMGIVLFRVSNSEDKEQKVVSILLFGALTGYVVQNFFVFDTVVPLVLFYVIAGYSLSLQAKKTFSLNLIVLNIVRIVLIVGFLMLFWFAGVLPWKESKTTANNIVNDKLLETESLYKISKMGYSGDSALFGGKIVGILASRKGGTSDEGKEKARSLISVLLKDLQNVINEDGKDNFRSQWVMGQLYLREIELDMKVDKEKSGLSRVHFFKALEINANNPLIYFDIAQTYAFEKDYKSAERYIKAGIALAPEYRTGYNYAQQAIDKKLVSKGFETYVSEMRNRWCSEGSACFKK